MTVTFITPLSGQPTGPGFLTVGSSDFIGPLPTGSFWELTLRPDAETQIILGRCLVPTTVPNWQAVWGTTSTRVEWDVAHSITPHGDTAVMRAELVQGGDNVVLDSATLPIIFDTVTGIPWFISNQPQTQTGGGLTQEEHDALLATQEQTIKLMGPGTTGTSVPIGDLLVHPPFGLLRIDPVQNIGVGDGALAGDPNLFPAIFGLWWEFLVIPPELGKLNGLTDHYQQRMLQLQTVHRVQAVDYVTEVLDVDYQRVVWLWREAKPQRIEFRILPGVTVAFHYVRWFTA